MNAMGAKLYVASETHADRWVFFRILRKYCVQQFPRCQPSSNSIPVTLGT